MKISWILLVFVTVIMTTITFRMEKSESYSAKIGWSLEGYQAREVQSVLVLLKAQADVTEARKIKDPISKRRYVYNRLFETAKQSQMPLVHRLQGKFQIQRFYIHNMVAVFDATPALIEELAARPDVRRIIGNHAVRGIPMYVNAFSQTTPLGVNDSLQSVGADRVWSEFKVRGENIVVAGQDTGVDWSHPALMAHYRGSTVGKINHNYNWHDAIHDVNQMNPCGRDSIVPCDDDQHGTHTLGTVVGDDSVNAKIGMAPGAKWIACRNMNMGVGTPASYTECFEFFLAPYPLGHLALDGLGDVAQAPHVINNSWGCTSSEGCEGDELLGVMQALKEAGIMVVASAGNDGPGCATIQEQPPTHSDVTLSVGAQNSRQDIIASFSSRGPSTFDGQVGPDVVAPGVNILSSVPGGGYDQIGWSGTSMAGPHVVGQVALMWSANPKLIGKIEETTEIIRKTATPKTTTESCGGVEGSMIPNNTYGYGFINAYAAVQAALQYK